MRICIAPNRSPGLNHQRRTLLAACLIAAALACTPVTPASSPRNVGGPESAPATRALTMVTGTEPESLTLAMGGALGSDNVVRLFNAGLALRDEREQPVPYLAEALPQLDSDSWRVFPDGRMETVYKLRPGLTWHDGTALSAHDFVFAWRVYSTAELGVAARPPQNQMESVAAENPERLVIRWRELFPNAGILGGEKQGFLPLPRHILESPFERGQFEAVANHPYWTRDYVGGGPYRLDRWEPGAFLEATAFGGHALGRGRIEKIRLLFINDPNTVVATLLSGEAHLADATAIRFEQAATLRRSWTPHGGGTVLLSPSQPRFTQVQLRPEVARPRALVDVRIRRAIAHVIDRQALNEALFEGEGIVADTLIPPTFGYFSVVDAAITKYPYDLRQSEQLMQQAGWARASDGYHADSTGGRFALDSWQVSRVVEERELNIMTDALRRGGFEANPYVLPPSQVLNHELKVTFSGLMTTSGGGDEASIRYLTTSGIPTAANRWAGGINYGGYSNPAMDRLFDSFNTTLDQQQQIRQAAEMMKLVSQDLPWIFLYYGLRPVAHAAALKGPQTDTPLRPTTWNVHAWELT